MADLITVQHNLTKNKFRKLNSLGGKVGKVALRKSANNIVRALEGVTSGWVNAPRFTVVESEGKASVRIDKRSKEGKIFQGVDQGVPRHFITSKGAYPMTFKWGGRGSYWPATTPGRLTAGVSNSLGPWRSMDIVDHPGIKPRNLVTAAMEKEQKRFLDYIEQEIKIWWKEA